VNAQRKIKTNANTLYSAARRAVLIEAFFSARFSLYRQLMHHLIPSLYQPVGLHAAGLQQMP